MPTGLARSWAPWLLPLALAVFVPRTLAARPLEFSITVLPPVPTSEGEFDFIRPVALNNRGQVAGTALGGANGGGFDYWVAFLYEPGRASRALDLLDSLQSNAVFLNEKGQVLGYSCCDAEHRYQFFLATGSSSFNRLAKGRVEWIRNDFHPTALTDQGDIAGFSSKFEDEVRYRRLPVLNLRGEGWIDLSKLDDRLEQLTSVELEVLRLNRFRDFVMPTRSHGVLGSFAGEALMPISPPELENTVGELSDAGEVVGEIHTPSYKYEPAGPERAYLFTPAEGLIEIHGDRFLSSRAVWITASGAVGGYATKRREWQGNDRLFTYDRSRGLRVTNLRRELRRARPKRKFGSATVKDMNEELQFIGEIQTRKKGDPSRGPYSGKIIHFLMDPQAGLIDLQPVLDLAGLGMEIFWLVDLNDEGQVLLEARRREHQNRVGLVLTPR